MTNLDSILKSRGITLPTKVHLVEAMLFPVILYIRESCTIKKAIAKELMLSNCAVDCALKILESPLDIKEIKPFNPKQNQP